MKEYIKDIITEMDNNESFTFIGDRNVIIEVLETYFNKSIVLPFDYRNDKHQIWLMARVDDDILIQKPLNTWDINMIDLVKNDISLPNSKEIKERRV